MLETKIILEILVLYRKKSIFLAVLTLSKKLYFLLLQIQDATCFFLSPQHENETLSLNYKKGKLTKYWDGNPHGELANTLGCDIVVVIY